MKLLSLLKKSKIGSSIQYQIKPQKWNLNGKAPVDWIPNHPFTSYFINEINMILPAGEFGFVAFITKFYRKLAMKNSKEMSKPLFLKEAMQPRLMR